MQISGRDYDARSGLPCGTLPADAGVVISASHNAYQDNGFKIFAPSGRKLDDETERLIEADIFASRERNACDGSRRNQL